VKKPKKPKFVHALLHEPPPPLRVAVWVVHDYTGKEVARFPFPRLTDAERMAKRDVPGGYVNLRKIPATESALA
jgi:hypothetical protein